MNTLSKEAYKAPLIIGSDHAAYPLKEIIKTYLTECGLDVTDLGTHSTESVNYTDIGRKVAAKVSEGTYKRGILLCGTGLGMSMVANRFKNVRAALVSEAFSAEMSRLHNDSNMLVLGGRVIGETLAIHLVKTWLETPFEGGRHLTRIQQIDSNNSV